MLAVDAGGGEADAGAVRGSELADELSAIVGLPDEVISQGLQTVFVLRDKLIQPLLAAGCYLPRGRKPKNSTVIDQHYDILRADKLGLFDLLGIAA